MIGIAISARKSEVAARQVDTTGAQHQNRAEKLEREARERAKEEADEWAAADQDGGDGGAPKPLERFGWPSSETVPTPMKSGRDRREEKRATEQRREVQGAKQSEAAYTASPSREKVDSKGEETPATGTFAQSRPERLVMLDKQEDSKGEEEPPAVTFPRSMSDRLAMLEKQEGDKGGVKLPANTNAT